VTSDFARQQDDFQRGILAGDDKVLGEILDSPGAADPFMQLFQRHRVFSSEWLRLCHRQPEVERRRLRRYIPAQRANRQSTQERNNSTSTTTNA